VNWKAIAFVFALAAGLCCGCVWAQSDIGGAFALCGTVFGLMSGSILTWESMK
jgi:FtsH-binding integral membrane protein